MGDEFYVKDRFMQNEFLYKIMRNERWVVYLILTFIIIIATFNMIGSIAMLVIDKRKDIGVLRSLGATERSIRNIFFFQGLLQTIVSIMIGFTIAIILCSIQIYFNVITIPGSDSFVVTAYPISMHLIDFILVAITILIIGAIAAYLPAHLASRQNGCLGMPLSFLSNIQTMFQACHPQIQHFYHYRKSHCKIEISFFNMTSPTFYN